MELLTLTEAAEITGLSIKTIQRHILKGKIQTLDTPLGKRIPASVLDPYKELRKDKSGQEETTRQDSSGQHETDHSGHLTTGKDTGETIQDKSGQVETDNSGQSRTVPDSGGHIPLTAHLAALELASRLQIQAERLQHEVAFSERRRIALELQLQQYQVALSENAESLAEERAKRLTLEAQKGQVIESWDLDALKVSSPKEVSESTWSRVRRFLFRKVI